jgi:hypothetical protein
MRPWKCRDCGDEGFGNEGAVEHMENNPEHTVDIGINITIEELPSRSQ